jgi:predicted pyridoxine 5'-phosphate oxidase superfamily flavin-nucleotide-binding protein
MKISDVIKDVWPRREGPLVLTTVSSDGVPNSIYATCVNIYKGDRILIADNYFDKTRRNLKAGSKGSVLFMTDDKKAYQLKGTLEYHMEGPLFDDMKKWNPPQHPGHAVAAVVIDSIYSGAKRLDG